MASPLDYVEETPDGWARQIVATWELNKGDDGTVRLWGTCPTCRHPSEFSLTATEYAAGFEKSSRPAANRVVIYCRCSFPHPRRPDEKQGCGRQAYFDLVEDEET